MPLDLQLQMLFTSVLVGTLGHAVYTETFKFSKCRCLYILISSCKINTCYSIELHSVCTGPKMQISNPLLYEARI